MDLKEIAAKIIGEFGKEDLDYLTVTEVVEEAFEAADEEYDEEDVAGISQQVIALVNSAIVIVAWEGDPNEYEI